MDDLIKLDSIFELEEPAVLGYLVHYAAPFTGSGEYEFPIGVRFSPHQSMRDDALYMSIIDGSYPDGLIDKIFNKEEKAIPELSSRLTGLSFYITEKQIKSLKLKFIAGSQENLLEFIEAKRNSAFAKALRAREYLKKLREEKS